MSISFEEYLASLPYTIERKGRDEIAITIPEFDRVLHLYAGPSCSYDDPCEHRAELGMSTWSVEGWAKAKAQCPGLWSDDGL